MKRSVELSLCALGFALIGCSQSYSPQTYSTSAVQQVNKVETGLVVGFRQVRISASGTVGAVTGGAAGGVLGSRSSTVGIDSALGTVGGTAIGTIIGTTVEHVSSDTYGWEYIVRKSNGDLLSVTQSEEAPLPLGQKVLVIAGNQARIVPDYSVDVPEPKSEAKPEAKPAEPVRAAPTLVPETHRIARPAEPPLLVVPLSSDYATPPPAPVQPQPTATEEAVPEPAQPASQPPEPQPAATPDAAPEAPQAPETAEAH